MNIQFNEEADLKGKGKGLVQGIPQNGPVVEYIISLGITESPTVALRIAVATILGTAVLLAFAVFHIIAPDAPSEEFDAIATPPSTP